MASPISFGDAYLMASLAFNLGRAFTKGRKSAPAEFQEVENQLYSLSAALRALKEAEHPDGFSIFVNASKLPTMSQPRYADENDIVCHILNNCEVTLRYLEAIVKKYSRLGN